MPRLDGLAVARLAARENLPVKILFLTIHADKDLFDEAIKIGAHGYLLKGSDAAEILRAIRAVAAGRSYTSPEMTTHLVERYRRGSGAPGKIADVTQADVRVLKLIAEYKTNKEIAAPLFISPRTVETHRTNICQKLDLHGTHALTKFAHKRRSELQ